MTTTTTLLTSELIERTELIANLSRHLHIIAQFTLEKEELEAQISKAEDTGHKRIIDFHLSRLNIVNQKIEQKQQEFNTILQNVEPFNVNQ